MDVLARLDEARAATNVLEHPFYRALERRRAERRRARSLRGRVSTRGGRARAGLGARRRTRRDARRIAAACAATPRRRPRTWRCGSSSSGLRFGRARPRPRPARAGRVRAVSWRRRVRACGRGGPARTCSSTSRCCTRSRPVSRRSRATKLEGLTRALRLQRGGSGDRVLQGPRAARRRARARGARADRTLMAACRRRRRAGRADDASRARRRCAATGCCSTGSKRSLSAAASTGRADRRHANSTAATEVARFRLETPARIGMLTRASALRDQLDG